ncbi:site-specific integrase [Spongiibacter sp. KMU-158]|uniref:Site-specific integrase n=1 Tax=Spongiibacter pelagi TaxID=2760804 RepID=A0A927C3N3_9GAMM|nr:site-specific integrase [Spongiibacter pelagi]MBD2860214.1 site-specific integrase [Spongiibacter pelagi]
MPRFSSPESRGAKQAASVIKRLQGTEIKSVGTARNYEQALSNVATTLARNNIDLEDLTPQTATEYLVDRATQVGQSALNMERQALQAMMTKITLQLPPGETLKVIKSEQKTILESRAYTTDQVQAVAECQTPKNALATEIAHAAGLRAHELATLDHTKNRPPDDRPALQQKFEGREGVSYTVEGKGGLVREVLIPHHLAKRLEGSRFPHPMPYNDRGVFYQSNYDIGKGQAWSQSFSDASVRALTWSSGAHGLRHSYAQERMEELQFRDYERVIALEVVSQEMGHFRPEITETYLR